MRTWGLARSRGRWPRVRRRSSPSRRSGGGRVLTQRRIFSHLLRDLEQPQVRVVSRCYFAVAVESAAQGILHVGLTRTKPDVADLHVISRRACPSGPGNAYHVWPARRTRWKARSPRAATVGRRRTRR